jgi:hypothetical protein
MVRVMCTNGNDYYVPNGVAVNDGAFPGTNMSGIVVLDAQGKEVGRFRTGEIVGYSIEPQ